MKIKSVSLLISALFPLFSYAATDVEVARYIVSFPGSEHVSYQGAFAKNFPQGLPVGIGSGLVFNGREGKDLLLTTLTDRGPNADAPAVGDQEAKIFANPQFVPLLMDIRVGDGKAVASNLRPLHDQQGPISGLPLPAGLIGSTNEVALSDTLKTLESDRRGLDTEGITPDGKGGYWLCDEYGPFLIHIDNQGKILAKYGPTPEQGSKRWPAGYRISSSGASRTGASKGSPVCRTAAFWLRCKVRSTSTARVKTRRSLRGWSVLIRPAAKRPCTAIRSISTAIKAKDAKVGDIVAVDNQHILLVEQGSDKDKQMINKIYLVDLSQASDLTAFDGQGKALEFDDAKDLAKRGVKLAQKREVVDLRKLGWQQEKVEGLSLIDDRTWR